MKSHVAVILPALSLAACATATTPASDPTPDAAVNANSSATFVVLAGNDTIAVERSTRTPTGITGELASRQQGIIQSWTIELSPQGIATGATTEVRRAGAAPTDPPVQSLSVTLADDSATVAAGGAERRIAAPGGTLPFVNLSARVVEQIVRQARAAGDEAATVPLLPFGAPQAIPAQVRWAGGDSAVISIGGVELHASVDDDGELVGATVPAQGVRFERATGDVALTTGPVPDYSAPPGAPYTAQDVIIRNEAAGVTLAGTLTIPRGASATARVPAVVFISGSGPQDRNGSSPALPGWAPFLELADTLSRRGVAVLRVDDRGVGGSQPGPAGATSADFVGDVRAEIAYLRSRPEIDASRIALLGHSEGGIIAPMVARTDSALGAVVLVAAQSRPGRVVSDSQVSQALAERGVPADQREALVRANAPARDSVAARNPWIAFWLDYDPLPAARELRVPVLIVQGETDTQVTPDQAVELANAIRSGGNGDVTVRLFPSVNHLLVRDPRGDFGGYAKLPSLEVAPEVLGAVADWLAERLGAGQ